jgi:hypothetical protein
VRAARRGRDSSREWVEFSPPSVGLPPGRGGPAANWPSSVRALLIMRSFSRARVWPNLVHGKCPGGACGPTSRLRKCCAFV